MKVGLLNLGAISKAQGNFDNCIAVPPAPARGTWINVSLTAASLNAIKSKEDLAKGASAGQEINSTDSTILFFTDMLVEDMNSNNELK